MGMIISIIYIIWLYKIFDSIFLTIILYIPGLIIIYSIFTVGFLGLGFLSIFFKEEKIRNRKITRNRYNYKKKLNSKEFLNNDEKKEKLELVKVPQIKNIITKRKSNWEEFEEVLRDENIVRLYHFTDESNLKSIIKNKGLYSWNRCEELGIDVKCYGGDDLSRKLDKHYGLEDYVRLSFAKNHPMKYVAKKEGRIPNPVVLEIDPSIIYAKDTIYSNMNATRIGHLKGGKIKHLKKINFNIINKKNYYDLINKEKPFFQAEVMVKTHLPLEYILNLDELLIFKKSLKNTLSIKKSVFSISDSFIKDEFNEKEYSTIIWDDDIEYKNKENIKKKYYESGEIKLEESYKEDNLEGKRITYYKNGKTKTKEYYKNGKLEGEFVSYYENGIKKLEENYKNDKRIRPHSENKEFSNDYYYNENFN